MRGFASVISRTRWPEALRLIAQSFERLGMTVLKADAERVLQLNYPAPVAAKGGTKNSQAAD